MPLDLSIKEVQEQWTRGTGQRAAMSRRRNYYLGKHDILAKPGMRHDGNNYNRVVMNWIDILVARHCGFMMGRAVNISVPDDDAGNSAAALEEYQRLADDQAFEALDSELFRDALLYGYGVELHGFNGDDPTVEAISPLQVAWVLDEDENEVAAIRRLILPAGTYYDGELLDADSALWWLYTDSEIVSYRERPGAKATTVLGMQPLVQPGFAQTFDLDETGRQRHAYGVVPMFRWAIGPQYLPYVTDWLIGLQNAYNSAMSGHLDDVETDIDALLAITGAAPGEFSRIDSATGKSSLQALREMGIIVFPDNDTSAQYLVRNLAVDKIDWTIKQIRSLIHAAGSAPDLDEVAGATGSTSGIALQLRFQAMIEKAMSWSKYIEQAFSHRFERLNAVWSALRKPTLDDYEIKISFELPVNEVEIWQNVMNLEPLLSKVDLARLVPAIEDPQAAIDNKLAEVSEMGAGVVSPVANTGRAATLAQQPGGTEGVIDNASVEMQDALAGALADQGQTITPDDMADIIRRFREAVS